MQRSWRGYWRLALNSGTVAPPGRGAGGSFYYPVASGSFDRVDVDPGVRLLNGPWAKALLAYAGSLVRGGGELSVPLYGRGAEAKGQLTRETLETHLGRAVDVSAAPGIRGATARARVVMEGPLPEPGSILSWYLAHALEVLAVQAAASEKEDLAGVLASLPKQLEPGTDDPGVPPEVESFVKQQGYYVGGIAYKAPSLAHIVRTFLPEREGLTVTDIGGGYGLLATELLIDPDVPVSSGTVVDHSAVNAALADLLARWLRDRGREPFAFIHSDVEAQGEIPPADVMVSVGTLLYVPRAELDGVLGRMWDALRPGGVLVVHENIKAPSYVRDYDLMFEPEELDSYLRRFGGARYFASSATVELAPSRVGRSSVFRVVAKPN